MLDICVTVYLDNILIYSGNKKQYQKQVKEVFQCLYKHGLFTQANKCEFYTDSVKYLGYILSSEELCMASNKVKTIQDWPESKKIKNI